MISLWNMLRLLCIYFILSIRYSLYGASPLIGSSVEVDYTGRKLPFIVSLTNRTALEMYRTREYFAIEGAHFCGGSLITRYHVLTAAHCLIPWERFDEVVVKIGLADLWTADDSDVREVNWWYTFCQYYNVTIPVKYYDDRKEDMYDIAIMKLMTPVSSDFPLPTISYISNELLYGKLAVVGGWGLIEKNVVPRYMRIARFRILHPLKCNKIMENSIYKINGPETMLCSAISCARTAKGDSGSPILYDGVNPAYPYNIIGIVKGGCQRGEGNSSQFINMHTSVNAYRHFIEKLTQKENGTSTCVGCMKKSDV